MIRSKICFCTALSLCTLIACTDQQHLDPTSPKSTGQWSYHTSLDAERKQTSTSASDISANETGISLNMAFSCSHKKYLYLQVASFLDGQPVAIKMKYADSGFGHLPVANIRAKDQHHTFNLKAIGTGAPNMVKLSLSPDKPEIGRMLVSPSLRLRIPTQAFSREITIELDEPNILKVFKDCSFAPAFMMTTK